jgi:hypothetical protein
VLGTEKTIWGFSEAALLLVDEAVREITLSTSPCRRCCWCLALMMLSTPYGKGGVLRVVVERSLWERYAVSTM